MKNAKAEFSRIFNPFKSVGAKLFLGFILSNVIFVSSVGFLSYSASKGIIKDKVASASQETINQAGEKLDLLYLQYEKFSSDLALDTDVQKYLDDIQDETVSEFDKIQTKTKLSDILTRKTFTDKNITNVTFIDGNSESIASSAPLVGTNELLGSVLKTAENGKGKNIWLQTTNKSFTGTSISPIFGLTRQVNSIQTGTLIGTLLVEIKASVLSNEISKIKLADSGKVYVISTDKTIVAAKNEAEVGKPDSMQIPVESMTKDENSRNIDLDQIGNVLLQSHKSAVNGWLTFGITPVNELINSTSKILKITLITLLIAIVCAILVGYFMVRLISFPLSALSKLMKEGEKGNLIVRANFKRNDEMGQLGTSFDQMMGQIQLLVCQTSESAAEVLNTANEILIASKLTAHSAREIAIATEEIAQGATGLSIEAEKGDSQTQEISNNMQLVIHSSRGMSVSAGEVFKASEQGVGFMAELISKTNSTENMTRLMADKVDRLKESTTSIRKILDVLNEMTKQTNILSLNATIEAARAGAAGRGFMVVADEIRRLAEQSKQSIAIVGNITVQIQNEVDQTVSVLTAAYPVFKEQAVSVKEAEIIFEHIQSHMGSFVKKLDDVTDSIQVLDDSQNILRQAMSNVSAVSQQSSATSEEVASLSGEQLTVSENLEMLSERLGSLSQSLQESLNKFNF
ncbi:MAG: chemotaxis protein [Bacilli bacterium]|nr:chemotaxis protein [Bacilli bacterium]